MAPLIPVITLALSLLSPLAVHAYGDDLNDFMSGYRAEQDRAHERQMQEYRAEEQAAQYRNEQAAERLNSEPLRYESPSYTNPTPQFNLYQGNDTQLCSASKYSVSCY